MGESNRYTVGSDNDTGLMIKDVSWGCMRDSMLSRVLDEQVYEMRTVHLIPLFYL